MNDTPPFMLPLDLFEAKARGMRWAGLPSRADTHGVKVATDPMWKRVAKDRAKRKAAKKQKQRSRGR